MRGEGEGEMTNRIEVAQAPALLEAYAKHFDPVLSKSNQREGFRRYLEDLLLPSERNKTLTGLVNTEPLVGAQLRERKNCNGFSWKSSPTRKTSYFAQGKHDPAFRTKPKSPCSLSNRREGSSGRSVSSLAKWQLRSCPCLVAISARFGFFS